MTVGRAGAPPCGSTGYRDPGLVNLNVPFELPVVVLGEQRADLLEHPVRGLVGDADLPLELLGADAAPGRRH